MRNRYNQGPHLIQDTECESDKAHNKHTSQLGKPRGQYFPNR